MNSLCSQSGIERATPASQPSYPSRSKPSRSKPSQPVSQLTTWPTATAAATATLPSGNIAAAACKQHCCCCCCCTCNSLEQRKGRKGPQLGQVLVALWHLESPRRCACCLLLPKRFVRNYVYLLATIVAVVVVAAVQITVAAAAAAVAAEAICCNCLPRRAPKRGKMLLTAFTNMATAYVNSKS